MGSFDGQSPHQLLRQAPHALRQENFIGEDDYGLISDCLDETRTARGSVLGIDSNFVLNLLKHFITQHCADTDFADEPHLDRGSTNRDA